ncbi:uncharacterized protein LOC126851405 isoform X2 [Cataglyphis hispanica]|uniref:uncharacterized protein LOC126851405 isoform X2 n=1 Tax=Cataglyphis hispanica TaxID=1086592 RepID=UPI00217FD3B1|nr:uncharacterized protein LOC126851405 isoform X2 [Cataglyphis hispanica]
MKTSILVIYILAITTIVYTANVQKVQIFYSEMTNCANQLHLPNQPSPNVLECVLRRNGLINELGMLNKYGTLRHLGDFISDPNKLRQAQNQFESCFNRNVPGRNNHENTMRIIECAAPMVALIG